MASGTASRTTPYPLTVGRGLDHNAGACPRIEHSGEALRLGADALLHDLTPLGEDVDLAFPLVDVNANMVHGWPLPSAALTAECSCGALCHHVKREASRFIPSSLLVAVAQRRRDKPRRGNVIAIGSVKWRAKIAQPPSPRISTIGRPS